VTNPCDWLAARETVVSVQHVVIDCATDSGTGVAACDAAN